MRFITLSILVFVLTISALSQASAGDTTDYYNKAFELYNNRQYEEAIETYLTFIQIEKGEPQPDINKISESLNNIGICYYLMNDYHEAISWYEKALEEDRKIGLMENIATRYNNLGLAYKKLGLYDNAISYYKKALRLDEEQGDTLSIAKSLNNLGSIYDTWGIYDTAIFYYEKSLNLKNYLHDSAGVAVSLNNIGLVYKSWEKYDQAIQYFEEALKIDRSLGKEGEIAKRLSNIGLAYRLKKQYSSALDYFHEALKMAEDQKNNDLIATLYNNIGATYLKQQQPDEAVRYLQRALGIYQDLGRQSNIAVVFANLAEIYTQKGNYNQALDYLSRSTSITENTEMRDQSKTNYLTYSDIYAAMGNYSEALRYYKKYISVKDTLYSEEIHKQITDFQVKYESEKKDNEINLLKQKEVIQALTIKKQKIFRNSLFGGIGLLLLLAIVIYFSLQQKRKANKIIEGEMAKSDKLLLNIFPLGIASDLKEKGETEPQLYQNVTVCFTDMVGFTEQAAKLEPKVLIGELNEIFTAFDNIVEKHACERIKTIGDSYLAVCGLPKASPTHAENIIRTAVEMIQYLEKKNLESKVEWQIRVGIHSGDVIAGVVGIKKYLYDVFGDTINTASRMESASDPMRINVSEATYSLVKNIFKFEERGAMEVKGKGKIQMYFIKS
jgi:adenylate cyclase